MHKHEALCFIGLSIFIQPDRAMYRRGQGDDKMCPVLRPEVCGLRGFSRSACQAMLGRHENGSPRKKGLEMANKDEVKASLGQAETQSSLGSFVAALATGRAFLKGKRQCPCVSSLRQSCGRVHSHKGSNCGGSIKSLEVCGCWGYVCLQAMHAGDGRRIGSCLPVHPVLLHGVLPPALRFCLSLAEPPIRTAVLLLVSPFCLPVLLGV